MRFYPILLSSVAITIAGIGSAAAYYYKRRFKEVNNVMMFCELKRDACNSLDKFISYIQDAKSCVYICTPRLLNPAIQGNLVKLVKEKKIKLRIIIGPNGLTGMTDYLLKELVYAGADVICMMTEVKHKYCLVDDKVLLTGTLDWGGETSCGHWWNYVYVTNKPRLVELVKADFYRMWSWKRMELVEFDILETVISTSTPIAAHVY